MVAISIALTISAAILLWMGLRNLSEIRRWPILMGVALLILNLVLVGTASASGTTGGELAFIASVLTAAVAVVSGLALALDLNGKRRLVSILVGVIYPATLILSAVR